ncbi:hypothetical protein Nepgr_016491 [Nepenthes gracilis]|uniref:Uncharacterized protein n=1 Tax=Nepenthes gracilis TaxID=150966 RepID=A0AAD3SPV1_NEPGR|nr:hypothetical protein Nepgr_016491 [Nepenthes gracilis]
MNWSTFWRFKSARLCLKQPQFHKRENKIEKENQFKHLMKLYKGRKWWKTQFNSLMGKWNGKGWEENGKEKTLVYRLFEERNNVDDGFISGKPSNKSCQMRKN